jgi:hypothetical protein
MAEQKQKLHQRIHHRWRTLGRWTQWTIISIVVLLVAARLAMPYAIEHYVNRQLNKGPVYGGSIGDVTVHLYRGAYKIHDIRITKMTGNVPVPLFVARTMDLSVNWEELFHGAVVGKIFLDEPQVNFVEGPTAEQSQTGNDRDWSKILDSLFPFNLNRFEIQRGRIQFHNFSSTPQVNIDLQDISAVATNLSNTRSVKEKLPAGLAGQGYTPDGGRLDIHLKMNPMAQAPTFELNAQLTNTDLTILNDYFKAYGKFDVERGTFSCFTSVAAKEGKYDGYIKIFFKDLKVFAWEKEKKKNILQIFWEAIVGAAAEILKNQPHDQLATKVPISGDFENTKVGTWTAVSGVLKNAFIRALVPKLDKQVKTEDVGKPSAEEKKKQ